MIKPRQMDKKKGMCCIMALLLFLVICTSCLTAQATETAISAVDMVRATKTDSSGLFVLEEMREGTAILSISAGTKEMVIQTEISENSEMTVDLYQGNVDVVPKEQDLNQEEQVSGTVCYRGIPLEGVSIKLYQETRSAPKTVSGVTYESLVNDDQDPQEVQQSSGLNPVSLALTPENLADTSDPDGSTENQGALKVTVTNDKNDVLENAIIAIYDKSTKSHILKNAIAYVNTAESGFAYFPELEAGEYVVKEMTAPTGYEVNSEAYPIEIRAGQEAKFTISHTVVGSTTDPKQAEETEKPESSGDAAEETSAPKGETTAAGTTPAQAKPVSAETAPQTGDVLVELQRAMMVNMLMMVFLVVTMIAFTIVLLIRRRAK